LLAEILNPVVTMPHHGENRLTRARTPAMIPGMFTLPMLVFVKKSVPTRGPKGLNLDWSCTVDISKIAVPVGGDEA